MIDVLVEDDRFAGRRTMLSSTDQCPWSTSAILRRAIGILADAGADSPRLSAEALLAHVLGITRIQLLARPEQPVAPDALARFERLIARAAVAEPLAYLTGHREFFGLDFVVDARVLVPRPETELLIDLALDPQSPAEVQASRRSSGVQCLDVGTGSGCIAVALAVHFGSAHITALDVSADALAVARLNAERHHIAGHITLLESDLLSAVVPSISNLQSPISRHSSGVQPPAFDLLCANLPYIPADELRRLPVARHEPVLALDGGRDGLDLIRRLLAQAPRVMAPQGRLLLEIGATQGQAVAALGRAVFPEAHVGVHQDLAGLDRVVDIRL